MTHPICDTNVLPRVWSTSLHVEAIQRCHKQDVPFNFTEQVREVVYSVLSPSRGRRGVLRPTRIQAGTLLRKDCSIVEVIAHPTIQLWTLGGSKATFILQDSMLISDFFQKSPFLAQAFTLYCKCDRHKSPVLTLHSTDATRMHTKGCVVTFSSLFRKVNMDAVCQHVDSEVNVQSEQIKRYTLNLFSLLFTFETACSWLLHGSIVILEREQRTKNKILVQ